VTGSTQSTRRRQSLRRIESEVSVLIRRVRRVIGERARAVHPELAAATYLLLAHVAETGPLRASALVDDMGLDKGAVSRQVTHLVELGLLERSQDPDDGRATLLAASDDARERLAAVGRQRSERFGQRLAEWSDEELSDLAERLARYNAALD
jgi:DNA-binding MarR family transcriptional regulator